MGDGAINSFFPLSCCSVCVLIHKKRLWEIQFILPPTPIHYIRMLYTFQAISFKYIILLIHTAYSDFLSSQLLQADWSIVIR